MNIDSNNHAPILRDYGITPDALLGRGMEATAYRYDSTSVLKIYHDATALAQLQTLHAFYDSLDASQVSYALPQIKRVLLDHGMLVTCERFMSGQQMTDALRVGDTAELDRWMGIALNALLELRSVRLTRPWDRYKLFDEQKISLTENGDWHSFLLRFLTRQLVHTGPALERDVSDFPAKVARLRERLRQRYTREYSLIHGDFFPGNLLVGDEGQVSGVLDFGLLTMWGDPLFDVATSWVFFDMYDELRANVWERYCCILEDTFGTAAFSTLALYILFYSIISANTYDPNCADGHYRWCAANLTNSVYWELLEG